MKLQGDTTIKRLTNAPARFSGSDNVLLDNSSKSFFNYSPIANDRMGFWAKKSGSSNLDLNDADNLAMYIESKGLKPPKQKRRLILGLIDIISRPLYASANIAMAATGLGEEKNILKAAWNGLSGKEKLYYSDVLGAAGVESKFVKGVVGFALDMAFDPLTWVGGRIVRTGLGGVKAAANSGVNVLRKFNPRVASGLEMAGKGLKDSIGYAFDINYKLTRKFDKDGKIVGTIVHDYSRVNNTTNRAYNELIVKNQKLFKGHSKEAIREAADVMVHNRQVEYGIREGITGVSAKDYLKIPKGEAGEVVSKMKKLGQELGEKISPATAVTKKAFKPYEWYIPMQEAIETTAKKSLPSGKGISIKEDFLKKFENKILPAGKKLIDPIEGYTRVEANIMRNNLIKSFIKDSTKTYGVTMSKAKKLIRENPEFRNILKNDYVPMYKKGNSGHQIGWLKKEDFRIIDRINNVEMNVIDSLAKASGFDSFTRVFKTAVTSYFPAFHVRNVISSFIQNYQTVGIQAFNPRTTTEGLAIMKGSKNVMVGRYSADIVHEALRNRFDRSSRFIADLGKTITEGLDGTFKVVKDPGRLVGNFIEFNQKAQVVSVALRRGDTLERALYLAEKAGFDYSMITKFESSVMKRLIPFYTYARRNAELQVRTLAKNPERILNQIKFTKNLGEIFGGKMTEEDLKGLPDWALNGLGFKIADGKFLTKFGVPLEEFTERVDRPMQSTMTSLNPLIKFPLESYLGFDFFRDQDIIDINRIAPGTGKAIMSDKSPDWLKDMMNVKEYDKPDGTKGYTASPRALHVIRNLPTSRAQGALESLFDGDRNATDKWLAFLSGIRIYDIDIELQTYFKERDMVRDMQDMLLKHNEGKKFEQFYIPK